ncbi:MAG: hypothetical protein UZ14_CFX002002628 [Chloroflexi bacterium OLB14]|nr:MAG: hypothetical protein UZ14_CFX002002628 [Chloroflexi bacterium OLB14]
MKIRWLAVAFTIFVALIIALADAGRLRFMLWFISRVPNLDTILHFLLIGILTFLVTASLMQTFSTRNSNLVAVSSILFFLIFFTLEEVSQGPIRGRDFSLKDLAANYAGILCFGFLAWWKFRRKKEVLK